jgi:NAD-dependent deacetylase
MAVDARALEQVAQKLLAGGRNVAFTGAGVSVESGAPDFRSPGGLWERFPPFEYATAEAFRADPGKVWHMFRAMGEVLERVEPNPAHLALARLEALGLLAAVITQNIDNLHQAAGSRRVIEFHGNARRMVCCCGAWEVTEAVRARIRAGEDLPPRCAKCGCPVKPDVVLFGDPIPPEASREAMRLAQQPGVFLVVGTSNVVAPASYLPLIAHKTGGFLVEVNPVHTELSEGFAHVSIHERAGRVLPALVDEVARQQAAREGGPTRRGG